MLQTKTIYIFNSMGTNVDNFLYQLLQAFRFELGKYQTHIIEIICKHHSFLWTSVLYKPGKVACDV